MKYIPVAEYTIGCCHYGQTKPYKTVAVRADSYQVAMNGGRKLLSPSAFEHLCHVETRPNPDHLAEMAQRNMKNLAYQATEEDVENVLRSNSLAVANTNGKSFESIATEVFGSLDFDLIEQAALFGDNLDEQTGYANDEIARQLREMGILEPLKQATAESPGYLQAAAEDWLEASELQNERDWAERRGG